MATSSTPAVSSLASIPRTAAQLRIITAALDQFTEHGVSGTSLQMIADAIGVTKAAVYHQYHTKDEIVFAVAEYGLVPLEMALDAAEAQPSREAALEVLLTEMIALAVENRRMVSGLARDPVVTRLLAHHEPFRRLMDRQDRILIGDDVHPAARLRAAMVWAAIVGGVGHPRIADIDDDTLRTLLLELALRFITVPA